MDLVGGQESQKESLKSLLMEPGQRQTEHTGVQKQDQEQSAGADLENHH